MTLYKGILIIHVLFGFSALVTGLLAILAKKGGKLHNRVGVIYYWAMFGVFITTVGLFSIRPGETFLQFFLAVAVISFYQTFTGRQALLRKKDLSQVGRLDWFAWSVLSLFSVGALGYSVWTGLHGHTTMSILFGLFAGLGFSNSRGDWRLFRGRQVAVKAGWLFMHIARMMASYAATVTAFLVNMSGRLPASTPQWVYLAVWIIPGVIIGGFGTARFTRQYRQKMTGGRKTPLVA